MRGSPVCLSVRTTGEYGVLLNKGKKYVLNDLLKVIGLDSNTSFIFLSGSPGHSWQGCISFFRTGKRVFTTALFDSQIFSMYFV